MDERTLNALRALNRVAVAASSAIGSKPPREGEMRNLADALTDYESTDAYDFVTDMLYTKEGEK